MFKVGIALLDDVGSEREAEGNVVLRIGFRVGRRGNRSGWNGDFHRRSHGEFDECLASLSGDPGESVDSLDKPEICTKSRAPRILMLN